MREFLFRGKRVDNGEWIEGLLVFIHTDNNTALIRKFGRDKIGFYDFTVDLKTVGQFTTMTDKNGKKVFGGDILYAPDAANEYSIMLIRDEGWCCFIDYYVKGIIYDSEAIISSDWLFDSTVIGNIHDNPELLEVK